MKVLKFGGSTLGSVASVTRVLAVIEALSRATPRPVVVVSALLGVTDRLLTLAEAAVARRRAQCTLLLTQLRAQHVNLVQGLIPKPQRGAIAALLQTTFSEIEELCEGIQRLHECSPRTRDRLAGLGEYLAAQILTAALHSRRVAALMVDARGLIVTDDQFGHANILLKPTQQRLQAQRPAWRKQIPVVTGFIAATADGIPTTIGRNGTDYTAAFLAAQLPAEELEIWKDVPGVMSADPTLVKDAFTLRQLSYAEAMEMAFYGAKVLHPASVIPAIEAKIPMRIRGIEAPEDAGTLITAQPDPHFQPVKGITSVADTSLVSLEGAGMIGVTGVAGRMFSALAEAQINVGVISQGSSEQSICCVVKRDQGQAARGVLRRVFAPEIRRKQIRHVRCRDDVCVVAVVGAAMRGTPGIAARLFSALGKNKINVIAVAQGSSEQNITLVLQEADRAKALNVIHGAFHLAARRIHVVVLGKGTIGSKLLEQFAEGQPRLERELDLRLQVVGIAGRRQWWFAPEGIALAQWAQGLARRRTPPHLARMTAQLEQSALENLIIVDATASDDVAKQYPKWLAAGMSVVTPNKRASTMPLPFYDELQRVVRRRHSYYLNETCVGAGLPIISTLQDLIDSGDEILTIEAALSGTLGYLFSELETGKSFSAVVRAAHHLGYTEPDPRDDLSGMDVARKILILARRAGARLSLPDVRVDPLLPAAWHGGGVAPFLRRLPALDAEYAQRVQSAAAQCQVLRYLGRYVEGQCAVQLRAVPRDSAFGRLQGGDNMVVFTTRRYRSNPLIVRGPGAGPEVTAGGVFADVLKVAHLLTST